MRNFDNSAMNWKDKYALQRMDRFNNIKSVSIAKIPKLMLKKLMVILKTNFRFIKVLDMQKYRREYTEFS